MNSSIIDKWENSAFDVEFINNELCPKCIKL